VNNIKALTKQIVEIMALKNEGLNSHSCIFFTEKTTTSPVNVNNIGVYSKSRLSSVILHIVFKIVNATSMFSALNKTQVKLINENVTNIASRFGIFNPESLQARCVTKAKP